MSITIQDLEVFIEHSSEMIGVLNADGIILKANKSWEKTFSKPLEEIIGSHWYELVPSEDEMHYKELFQKLFIEDKVEQHYFSMVNSKSEWITIDTHMIYVDDLIYLKAREFTREDTLLQSLQMMSRVAKIGGWHYNVELKKFYCSEECLRIFEIPEGTPITLDTIFEHYIPKHKAKIKKKFNQLIQSLIPFEYVGKINTLDKSHKWIDFKAEIISYHGDLILVSGIIADVTKEQEYLERLRYNADTQKLALKGIKSGIFDHDLKTDTVYYSKHFKRMLGLSLNNVQIPEPEFRKMIHPDDAEAAYQRHLDGINSKGYHYFNHYRLKNIEGVYHHYEVYGYRKKDKKTGKAIRMIGNLINIEDQVQKQLSIAKYQRHLKAVINNGYLYTVLLDADTNILFIDNGTKKAVLHYFKIEIDENGTDNRMVFLKSYDPNFKTHYANALKGKKSVKEISKEERGEIVWYEMNYTPIKNEKKVITNVLINFLNITSRKKAEIQYKEAKHKTEELSDLKSSILMNLSHEIRTPLNGIIGVNELLSRQLSTDERKELLKIQKESSDRLINTLEGMINLSQMNSLNSKLDLVMLEVNTLVKECYEQQLHIADSKGISFDLELTEQPATIMGDHNLFHVAISQIINNAIKFTNQGMISIRVTSKSNHVKIAIKDTGIGIRKKNQKKVFEMFVQESQGLSRKYEGTGIGLTMAKKYIELMDGVIKVKSEPQKGSNFSIKFPLST